MNEDRQGREAYLTRWAVRGILVFFFVLQVEMLGRASRRSYLLDGTGDWSFILEETQVRT